MDSDDRVDRPGSPTVGTPPSIAHPKRRAEIVTILVSLLFLGIGAVAIARGGAWVTAGWPFVLWGVGGVASVLFVVRREHRR